MPVIISADTLVAMITAACLKVGYDQERCFIAGVKVTNCSVNTEGSIEKKVAEDCVNKYIDNKKKKKV